MIALQVADVRDFMNKLFLGEVFDNFLLSELEVANAATIQITGKRNQSWYGTEEWEDIRERSYVTWRELRPLAFQIIKGQRTPLSMKGVFLLSEENTARVLERNGLPFKPEEVGGLYLNLRYDGKELKLVTGVSLKSFSTDKSLERQWDKDLRVFLKHHEIAVEEL